MSSAPQPIHGLLYFLAQPRMWAAPIGATILGIGLTLIGAVLMGWWQWPAAPSTSEEIGWWATLLGVLWALAAAGLTATCLWLLLLPILIGIAYERLVCNVYRHHDVPVREETTVAAVASAASVLLRSLPWIIGWLIIGLLVGWFMPPLGLWASQMALAHLTILSAADVALALRGQSGKARWQWLQQRRSAVLRGALIGSLMGMVLGMLMIGWLLFIPALFTASALWVGSHDIDGDGVPDLPPDVTT